ncbi:MAG: hypothetical protein J6S14_00985, partial [Clostridia bacterium]|nr:hypothetical protein [Clostridia bacterium]
MKNEKLNLNESNEIKDISAEELSLMSVSETESTTEVESPDKYVDHQQYYTTENGRAGVGSVNLFDGSFTFEHLDLEAKGVKMPMTLSHIYRDRFMKNDQAQTGLPVFPYGMGWRLSVAQTLRNSTDEDVEKIYTDGQGREHYFVKNDDETITDTTGLGLTYTEVGNQYHITDEIGTKMIFNSDGLLEELCDANGTKSILTYSEDGKLVRIENGVRDDGSTTPQIITLTYEQNKLVKVQESGGYTITYEYDGKYLKSITYPSSDSGCCEGALQTKFYYYNNHLYRIIDQSGMVYYVGHELDGKVTKIRLDGNLHVSPCCAVHGSSSIADEKNFEYRAHSTVVEDELTKIKTVYRFDEDGRPILSYRDVNSVDRKFFYDENYLETTLADLAEYQAKPYSNYSGIRGKYRSLSVQLSRAAESETNLWNGSGLSEFPEVENPEWENDPDACVTNEMILNDYHSGYAGINISDTISGEDIREQDGNVMVVSAWAKPDGRVSMPTTTVKVSVAYVNASTKEFTKTFVCDDGVWQFIAVPIVLENKEDISSVTIQFLGSGIFFIMPRAVVVRGNMTEISLPRAELIFPTIQSDNSSSQKNVFVYRVESSNDSYRTTENYYNSNKDLFYQLILENSSGERVFTECEYDSRHNLLKSTDCFGMVTEYEYTPAGEVSSEKRYRLDSPGIYSKTAYTYENGHYLKTESDPRYTMGSVLLQTTYEYDPQKWLMTKQTAPNGRSYEYDYDSKTEELRKISSTVGEQTLSNEFCYTMGYPTSVSHNGFSYDFGFDGIGRQTSIRIAGNDLAQIAYDDVEKKVTTTYGTGDQMLVKYDIFGAPVKKSYKAKDASKPDEMVEMTYDTSGNVKEVIDSEGDFCYNYTYDSNGNISHIEEENTETGQVFYTEFEYDDTQRLTSKTYESTGQTYRVEYESNKYRPNYPLRTVTGLTLDGVYKNKVVLDKLRRVSEEKLFLESPHEVEILNTIYTYVDSEPNSTRPQTSFVSKLNNLRCLETSGTIFDYTYDRAGNIETVTKDDTLIAKYTYDRLNRLTREDNYESGKTTVFSYDVGGNITSKKEYAVTSGTPTGSYVGSDYTYATEGWKDQLVSFNGEQCVYDEIGNPTTYRNHNLSWTKVRRLASFDGNNFSYNAAGIRTKKNKITYTLDSNKIL